VLICVVRWAELSCMVISVLANEWSRRLVGQVCGDNWQVLKKCRSEGAWLSGSKVV